MYEITEEQLLNIGHEILGDNFKTATDTFTKQTLDNLFYLFMELMPSSVIMTPDDPRRGLFFLFLIAILIGIKSQENQLPTMVH